VSATGPTNRRIGIVGAGLAGLMAARDLHDAGHQVVVFDKGRSPGGRLATRRIGDAVLDHGAQFFTVRTERFQREVDQWLEAGLVEEWCRGFTAPGDGHPRYIARRGMNSIAKHLAVGLDVRCGSLVFSLHAAATPRAWEVKLDDGSITPFDALVVTCPLPQTFSLLVSAEVQMPEPLWRTPYDTTLALLVVLDRPSSVPAPGGVQSDPNFTFIGDNQRKGVSPIPAVTFHANPAWSDAHWDEPAAAAHAALLDLARPWLGDAVVVHSQLKRWRFATPRSIWPEAHWSPDDRTDLAVAGDAFAGPKMEGAALSGLSAAAALRS
jgi:renalase